MATEQVNAGLHQAGFTWAKVTIAGPPLDGEELREVRAVVHGQEWAEAPERSTNYDEVMYVYVDQEDYVPRTFYLKHPRAPLGYNNLAFRIGPKYYLRYTA
jgi:hypothetical protein